MLCGLPAELFDNLVPECLGPLGIVLAYVYVGECPFVFPGYFCASPIDAVIVALDADYLRPVHQSTDGLPLFKVCRHEYVALEARLHRLGCHRVSQVTSGGAGDSLEAELLCLRECGGYNPVFKAPCRIVYRVVLYI